MTPFFNRYLTTQNLVLANCQNFRGRSNNSESSETEIPNPIGVLGIVFLIIGGIYFFVGKKTETIMVGDAKGIVQTFKFSSEKMNCAKEGEKVNRNPLIGPINQPCCPGLLEVRESKSYSVCKKAQKVLLYYYNPEKDKDETGNTKCSRDGLMPIEREIPTTKTPIQDTINLLLKGKENLTENEIAQGITTEYPLEGFKLKSANLKEDGTLILEFDDPLNKTTGGSCRVGILWFQIEATAKQFPQVKEVRFLPEEIFQP